MRKIILLFLFLVHSSMLFSQNTGRILQREDRVPITEDQPKILDDVNVTLDDEKPPISLYRIIILERDTTYVDTTLTIQKHFQFNFLRKDKYFLMPFSNVGQAYNTLAYEFDEVRTQPQMGFGNKHFNYMEIEDIKYYHVPTPLTELYFKTAFEQGQQLDAFFTINTTEQFNFSIAYKGLRSLGNYQNSLVSSGNFRFTTNYISPNKKYNLRAHAVFQDIFNEENNGLKPDFIEAFVNNTQDFRDRGRLEVQFEDAHNELIGRRFFVDQEYSLFGNLTHNNKTSLRLGNQTWFENKSYRYIQDRPFEGFGPAFASQDLKDRVKLEKLHTNAFAHLNNPIIGSLKARLGYTHFDYGYNRILILENEENIPNKISGNILEFGGEYHKEYCGFELFAKASINVLGDYDGHYLLGQVGYQFDHNNKIQATAYTQSVAPDFQFQLYQSDYVNYNWFNNYKNIKTQHLEVKLSSKNWFDATVSYTGIDDYTYFSRIHSDYTKPQQFTGRINYLKIDAQRQIDLGYFSFLGRLTYQQVLDGEEVFKTPELLTRVSAFYSNHFFNKALFLQTGISGRYFSKYEINGYDPVLGSFFVQDQEKIGGFPMLDFFINAKVSQTRIYLKWEHFNALFGSKNNYFAAPGQPYRDAKIRFGLVWNFFM